MQPNSSRKYFAIIFSGKSISHYKSPALLLAAHDMLFNHVNEVKQNICINFNKKKSNFVQQLLHTTYKLEILDVYDFVLELRYLFV